MSTLRIRLLRTAAALAVALAARAAAAEPLLLNSNFKVPSGNGPTTLTTDANGGVGPSAAKDWIVFNDTAGTTTTDLEPSTLTPPGGNMIHVTTSAIQSGLYQDFTAVGPTNVYTCAWIYVVSGAVGIGSGLEAATTIDAALFKTGSWEVLNVGNQSTPAYTTIIYNIGPGPAEFYVKSIGVSTSHAQCKPR